MLTLAWDHLSRQQAFYPYLHICTKMFYHIYCLFYTIGSLIFRPVDLQICQPLSAHELQERFMLLTLFTQLSYDSLLN